jgi:ABC-type nitrate/sulfonate/bicarbonate transport system permease component
MAPGASDLFVGLGPVLALLFVWEAAAQAEHSLFFPPPTAVFVRVYQLWLTGPADHLFLTDAAFRDVIPSIGRMLAGWCAALGIGILCGTVIGRSRVISDLLTPGIEFVRAVPSPALIPVFLILLGTETTMRVTLIAFGSVWPILLNTIDGVARIEPRLLDTARIFDFPRSATIFRVVLPFAAPKICAGARIATSTAVILMVVSELVASADGIGHHIVDAQQLFLMTDMWAGIVLLAGIGFTLNLIFSAFERRMLRWHFAARGRAERQ